MTILRLRPLSPSGTPEATSYRLRLVNTAGESLDGVQVSTGQPILGAVVGTIDATVAAVDIPLIPQDDIATRGGVASRWELFLRSATDKATWLLIVPESAVPLDVLSLIMASVAPVEVAAALVARVAALEANQLPDPGTPGQILVSDGTDWVPSTMGEET